MGWTAAVKTRIMTGPASQVVHAWGHVRPTESAFILAAHLFLSVFPLLLVLSLFAPHIVANIGEALRDRLGLQGPTQQAVKQLIGGTQTGGGHLSTRMTEGAAFAKPLALLASAFMLWWWTPYVLLGGRVRWRPLAATGVFSAIAVVILGVVSSIYMPYVLSGNESKYGAIGVVFALESWLAVLCGALVFCAILGAVVSRLDSSVGRLVRGSADVEAWRR